MNHFKWYKNLKGQETTIKNLILWISLLISDTQNVGIIFAQRSWKFNSESHSISLNFPISRGFYTNNCWKMKMKEKS
jgi:hypothetical protein